VGGGLLRERISNLRRCEPDAIDSLGARMLAGEELQYCFDAVLGMGGPQRDSAKCGSPRRSSIAQRFVAMVGAAGVRRGQ
jgi:hypothetical protein